MTWISKATMFVLGAAVCATGEGALTVTLNNVTAAPNSNFTMTATFSNNGAPVSTGGYNVQMYIVGANNSASLTASDATSSYGSAGVFASIPLNPIDGPNRDVYSATDSILTNPVPIIPAGDSTFLTLSGHLDASATGSYAVHWYLVPDAFKSVIYDSFGNPMAGVTFVDGSVAVPEPASLGLIGLAGLLLGRRRVA